MDKEYFIELNEVKNRGTWSEQTAVLNDNFRKIQVAEAAVEELAEEVEGYKTLLDSKSMEIGATAFDAIPTKGSVNPVTSDGLHRTTVMAERVIGNPTGDWDKGTAEAYIDKEIAKVKNWVSNTPVTDVVVVEALPASGKKNTLYRVKGTNAYSEYGWDGSKFVLLAVKDYGIDEEPVAGSENLVTSGGVKKVVDEVGDEVLNLEGKVIGRYVPDSNDKQQGLTDAVSAGNNRYLVAMLPEVPTEGTTYSYKISSEEGFAGVIKRISFGADGTGTIIKEGQFVVDEFNSLYFSYSCKEEDSVSIYHNILCDCTAGGKVLCERMPYVYQEGLKDIVERVVPQVDSLSKEIEGELTVDNSSILSSDSDIVPEGSGRYLSVFFETTPEIGNKYQYTISSVDGFVGEIIEISFGTSGTGDVIYKGSSVVSPDNPLIVDYDCVSDNVARYLLIYCNCITQGNVRVSRKKYVIAGGLRGSILDFEKEIDSIESVVGAPYDEYINESKKTSTQFSEGSNRYINVMFDTEFVAGRTYKLTFDNKEINGTINAVLLGPSGNIETLYEKELPLSKDAQIVVDCKIGWSRYLTINLSADSDGTIDVVRSEKNITSALKKKVDENSFSIVNFNSYFQRRKVESLFIRNRSITEKNDFRFGLVSDLHATSQDRFAKLVSIVNEWGLDYFDCLINCGDTVDGTMNESLSWYNEIVDDSNIDILNCIGNHDAWTNTNPITLGNPVDGYNLIISKVVSIDGIVQPPLAASEGKCYYYKDYNSKVRVIVIDIMWWNEDEENWLKDVLNDAKNKGLAVMIVTHANFKKEYYEPIQCSFTYPLSIGEDSTFTPIEAAVIVDEFVDGGGIFICWVAGHAHMNIISKLPNYGNQVIIQTTSMNQRGNKDTLLSDSAKDYNYLCAEYIGVDIENNLVKMLRLGSDITPLGQRRDLLCIEYKKATVI